MAIPKITFNDLDVCTGSYDGGKYVYVSDRLEDDPEDDNDNIIWGAADSIEDAKEEAVKNIQNYNQSINKINKQFTEYSIEQCTLYESCLGMFEKQIMVTVYSESPIPNNISVTIDLDEETMSIII